VAILPSVAGFEVRAGELADFIAAIRLGQFGLGSFFRDARESLRESPERPHDSAGHGPREAETQQPEDAEHRESAPPPKSASHGLDAEDQQAHLPINRNPHTLPATPGPHDSRRENHRLGKRLSLPRAESPRGIRHRGQRVSALPEIHLHSEHFAQSLRGAFRRGQSLAADELRIGISHREESGAGLAGLLELQPRDQHGRTGDDKAEEHGGKAEDEAAAQGHGEWILHSRSGKLMEHNLSIRPRSVLATEISRHCRTGL
jgi:hypothetical protein